MIDFPLHDLMDEQACLSWLEKHLHPDGLKCPHCGSRKARPFRREQHFHPFRCKGCDGRYTMLSNTPFHKTRLSPSQLVMLLRGIAKGESSARSARELGYGRKQVWVLRQRVQNNLYDALPVGLMEGKNFEADELYQNAGEKKHPSSRSEGSAPPSRE